MTHAMQSHTLFLLGILFALFLVSAPANVDAYYTTGQNEVKFDAHTGLFLIDFSFGMEKRAVSIPIKTQQADERISDTISYAIVDETGAKVAGTATGIVLSSAPIDHTGMYVIPKGVSKKFTLAVFFTPETPSSEHSYRLQVTQLPFQFDGVQQLQLNPSELKYYTTKLLAL